MRKPFAIQTHTFLPIPVKGIAASTVLLACAVLTGCLRSLPQTAPAVVEQSSVADETPATRGTTPPSNPQITADQSAVHQALVAHFNQWNGVPYRLGGYSKTGIDCSGFTQLTYQQLFAISLPRTTQDQVQLGQPVSRSNLQPGDLVFFHTGWRRQRHVGIYLQDQVFLHASTSRGVMLSRLDNPYWQKAWWKAVRIQPLPALQQQLLTVRVMP